MAPHTWRSCALQPSLCDRPFAAYGRGVGLLRHRRSNKRSKISRVGRHFPRVPLRESFLPCASGVVLVGVELVGSPDATPHPHGCLLGRDPSSRPHSPSSFAQIVGSRRSPLGLGSDHSTTSHLRAFMYTTSCSRASRTLAERHGVTGRGFEFIRTRFRSPRRRISLIQAFRHFVHHHVYHSSLLDSQAE